MPDDEPMEMNEGEAEASEGEADDGEKEDVRDNDSETTEESGEGSTEMTDGTMNDEQEAEKMPPKVNKLSLVEVSLALKLTASEPIKKSYLTYIGWAIPSKHSDPGEFQLYEGGVLRYNPASSKTPLSLYQTVTVTPNGLRPSQSTEETILANIVGAEEKYDLGDEEIGQSELYWNWDQSRDFISKDRTELSIVLTRKAWSDTIDFYAGGKYTFYTTLTQHRKDKTKQGDIAATGKIIEIFLAEDPELLRQIELQKEAQKAQAEEDGTAAYLYSFQAMILFLLFQIMF